MPENLKTALHRLSLKEKLYAEQFSPEANRWEVMGIYESMSRSISHLKPGDIHVDLGCGKGNLVSHLHRNNPDAQIVGVEMNRGLVSLAVNEAVNIGLQPIVYHREVAFMDSAGHLVLEHLPLKKTMPREAVRIQLPNLKPFLQEDDREISPGITFVIDDIRSAALLKKILGLEKGKKIDSFSITLPGGSSSLAYQSPYSLQEVPLNDIKGRIKSAVNGALSAGFAFAADYLKPGSHLTYADRIFFTRGSNPIDGFVERIKAHMGEKVDNFDEPSSGQLIRIPFHGSPGGVAWGLLGNIPNGDFEVGIAFVEFTKLPVQP